MGFAFFLLAEEAAQSPEQPWFFPLIPFIPLIILFYLVMLRPMRRQEQQQKALLAGLKKNDKVVTSGGIIGVIAAVKDKEDEVVLKVDENSNVRLRVTRSSIARVLSDEAGKETKEGGA